MMNVIRSTIAVIVLSLASHAALADEYDDAITTSPQQRRALGIGGAPILEVDGTLLHADVDDATLEELARV